MKSSDSCCVCLTGESLISLSNVHYDSNTIYSILSSVVPEVHWQKTFSICSNCLRTLDLVIEFKNLCLKSNCYRLEQTKKHLANIVIGLEAYPVQNEETNDYEVGELHSQDSLKEGVNKKDSDENSDILCKVCSINLKSFEYLHTYNKKIAKDGHLCSNCFFKNNDLINHKINKDNKISVFGSINEEINLETIKHEKGLCKDVERLQYNSNDFNNSYTTEILHEKIQNEFVCFHCNKSYTNKVILAKHIKLSHQRDKHTCSHCTKIFTNKTLLKKHFKKFHDIPETHIVEKNKLYECGKCKKSYKVEKVMKNHYEICDGMKRHSKLNSKRDILKNRCETCGRFYTTEKILKAHTKTCCGSRFKIEDEEIKCRICDILFINDQLKLEHVLKEHNVNLNAENICPYCYKQSLSAEEYKDHLMEIHSDEIFKREQRSYSCEVCLKIFRYVKDVIEHCVKKHEMDSKLVKPFLCDQCDTRFTSSANMIQHKQYHEGTRSHICSFCGKSYITKSDLTVHEYTHLNKRNYKCEICDRAFNTNKNLRSHKLVVHTDSSLWKYPCNMCDKRFPLKSGYDQHTRRHTGDKRFQCLICPKSFISSSELRKHMTFHSNVKAFKCSHCDKEYKDRRVYEIHLTKVHGIGNAKIPIRVKKFACHICPSTFFDKQKLSRHLCTHTGIKPYACTMCEKRFTDKSYLKHHLKVTHNVVELHFDDTGDVKVMQ